MNNVTNAGREVLLTPLNLVRTTGGTIINTGDTVVTSVPQGINTLGNTVVTGG